MFALNRTKGEHKGRAAVLSRAFRPDTAAVPLHDMLADCQAQPGGGLAPVPFHLVETLENAIQVRRRDAGRKTTSLPTGCAVTRMLPPSGA